MDADGGTSLDFTMFVKVVRKCNAPWPGSFRLGGFLSAVAMSFSQVKDCQRKGEEVMGSFPSKFAPPKSKESSVW